MKSKLIKILTVSILLTQVNATNTLSTTLDTKNMKQEVMQIDSTITNSINVNGQEVELYPEFVNNEEALKSFKEKYQTELLFIQEKLELEDLTLVNWKEYNDIIIQLPDLIEEIPENILINLTDMEIFFDIYENSYKNLEVLEFCNKTIANNYRTFYVDKNFNIDKDKIEDLNILLPYTSEINTYNKKSKSSHEDVQKHYNIEPFTTIGINKTAAINYATNYATSRNTSYYASFSSDCTNFVSQILENGGISQVISSSENSGWWHKKVTDTSILGYHHKHSISWINADTFCRYMGVSYKTKIHLDFSSNLSVADIIAFDKASDGDWDHVGFVTLADGYTGNYNGKVYCDYKVAQHTTDYNAWTSSSTNSWETLEDKGYTYAIIRR